MRNTHKTTLKTGDVLNSKWVILSFIDKGGMGEVYRAHQINLNRDVAIKVISREWLESIEEGDEDGETLFQRFRREVQAMAQINHPNILQVFDQDSVTVQKGDQKASIEYIAMEYIPGGSLRSTMPEEGFYPDETAVKEWIKRYFIPVLAGVKALHDNGIVHRDLKPENIFMDQDTPKIADFGLARSSRLKPITQSMDVKGSPCYMSPEHFFNFKRADQRADLYSLGKILFEIVEGKINSDTVPFKSVKLSKTETSFFKELDRIIQMATAENKDERTESVQELIGQLERVIHGLRAHTKASMSSNHVYSLFSRPKWIWTGIMIAVLSAMSMSVWHFMGALGSNQPKHSMLTGPDQPQAQATLANRTTTNLAPINKNDFSSEHLGRQYFIRGGTLVIPAFLSRGTEVALQVKPFYLDEFFVTNQQFVDFLNHNLSQIRIEDGVVKRRGENWLLLGEVRSGYEPVVYRNKEFHISNPAYASSPILRVTGYGASAFASYFGRRLPTETEILFTMLKGTNNLITDATSSDMHIKQMDNMMQMVGNLQNKTTESNIPIFLLSASSFSPNLFGIKGLKHGIGEWLYTDRLVQPSGDPSTTNRYAVIGGIEGAPKDHTAFPLIVVRFPWEGFEEIAFRTAKSASVENSTEHVRRQ